MQTRDGLTDNVVPRISGHATSLNDFRRYPGARRTLALIASLLVPGGGHFALGRFGRGLLFLALIGAAFFLGLALNGRLYWPMASETPTALYFDLITILWFLAQIGTGLCYVVAYALGIGLNPQYASATYEYGNTFMFLAGLLNYLVMYDAFDIGAGRKR